MTPYLYPDEGPIAFRRDRDLGGVIRATLQWMREMAGVWIPAIAAIAGPFYLLSAIASSFVNPESGGLGLLGLVDGAAGLLMSATTFGIVRQYRVAQSEVPLGTAWEEAKAWFWPLFGFGFVTALFAIALVIPFGVILALTGGEDAPVGVWIALGLAGLVAMILAAPYYTVGLASRIFDEDNAVDAYRRGAGLVAAHRGFATGTVIVVFGMVYFIIAVLGAGVVELLRVFAPSPILLAIGSVVSLVALVPAGVFGNVASVFLFETLVEREEGTLLDAEIDAIRDDHPAEVPRTAVVPPPRDLELEAPDTRSFADRLRDDQAANDDASSRSGSGSQESLPQRGGFRGGGFEDGA